MNSDVERVWEIIEDLSICMVTTHTGAAMRACPMHAIPDRDEGCIWLITDARGANEEDIARSPDVCLTFQDTADNTYLSLTGRAETVKRAAAKPEELWTAEAQAWWPRGPSDPAVRVLRVVPERGEHWDTRGSSVSVPLKLAMARTACESSDLGDDGKVRLR